VQDTEIEYMAEAARRQQTTETIAKLHDGKLRLERRNGSPKISARTFLQGKNAILHANCRAPPRARAASGLMRTAPFFTSSELRPKDATEVQCVPVTF
jgi:hypothetical protein